MRWLLKGALAHPTRLIATAVAVALAVALVSGTFVLSDTIQAGFHQASATPDPGSDVVVRARSQFSAQAVSLPQRDGVPESLLARVAAVPGVRTLWSVISGYAQLVDKQGKAIDPKGLPTVGGAWAPGDALVAGRPPTGPDEVAIDASTARQHQLTLGDKIRVVFQGKSQEFTIGGLLRKAGDVVAATKAAFDPRTAQQVLGADGVVDGIPVKAAAGVSPIDLRARINAVLPDRYEAVTSTQVAREAEQSWTKAVAFLPTSLLLLAGVSLLVGALLIFNTFSMLVAQRTRELALLRALGAGRAQLTLSVLGEALAVGLVASAAGIALGLGMARGMLELLHRAGFELPAASVELRSRTAAAGLLAGVVVTAAAAFVPARRASRLEPAGTIGGLEDGHDATRGRRVAAGAAAAVAGVGSLVAGLFGGRRHSLLFSALGTAGVLVGLAVLIPLVTRPASRLLGAPLVRLFRQPAFLGRENAMRNPRRTSATAAALMIGIGLVGVVAIVAASMKASARDGVQRSLRADLVVAASGTPGSSGGVPNTVADVLRRTPAVAEVSEIRGGQWGLNGSTQTVLAVDPATVSHTRQIDRASAGPITELDDHSVLVRDTVAEHHGWKVGDEVPMTFARTGTQQLRVMGLFSATAVRTDYVISLAAYRANFAQQLDLDIDVKLHPGVSLAQGRADIEGALRDFPVATVMDRSQVLAAQQKQVDRLLVPVTALLALSVVIALLGIANTLALSILERIHELGMLRAIGMARAQVRSMIRSEAVIIASLGSSLGVAIAVFFGWALVSALDTVGVTTLVLPVGQLGGLVAAATVAGLLAGVLPARRAARMSVLVAVGSDR